ncbi:hypothetical protein AC1031_010891 [Aphanomyces cochlioides]|nr:hypothetical protein AC1031_010891 [Aphanomyces cochlioides]
MRFKGAVKTKTGSSKKTIANEISVLLRSHGLYRDGSSVLDKIARLNASFVQAKDWERQTGQGHLENVRKTLTAGAKLNATRLLLKQRHADDDTVKPQKKELKLVSDKAHKSFGESIASAMKDQIKVQLQFAHELMETRKWEAELRQKEVDVKAKEQEVLQRKQIHDEIMRECGLMREMNSLC